MKFCGQLYEVTRFMPFAQRYLADNFRPNQECVRPVGEAQVGLYRCDGADFRLLAETNTDRTGRYELDLSVSRATSVFLVASGSVNGTEHDPRREQISGWWYRSSPSASGAIDERPRDIYMARLAIPSESGFSQRELDTVLSEKKKQVADVEQIAGTIAPGAISFTCSGKGAKATAKLVLKPEQSGDLNRILRHSIEEFHLELPGPSWLTGLVVSRDAIETTLRTGLQNLAIEIDRRLHQRAIALFTEQVRKRDQALADRLADETTLSLGRLHYAPASSGAPSQAIRTITGDACLGFPKTLGGRLSTSYSSRTET